jgi:DNA-binding MarR family transcriptional regulator
MRAKFDAAGEAANAAAPRARRRKAAKGVDQDEPFDLYETPGHLIRRLHQIVVSLCYEGWGELAISPVQYGALMAIRAFPGIDQRGLSRAIAIDRSTIGTVGEQLERRGLIERRTGTRDKRNKELFLTAKGAEVLRRAHPIAWEIQDRVLAPLAPKERREFVRLLAKLVERNNRLSRAPLGPTGFEAD